MRRGIFFVDFGLLVPSVILCVIGLATIFSINISIFLAQFFYFLLSIFSFLFFSHINYNILERYSIPIYIISLISLLLVPLLGLESRGAVRWVYVFGIGIQFSEILKPFLLISLGSYLANSKNKSFSKFIFTLIFLVPIVFLILVQPDLGNVIVYLSVVMGTLIVYGFPILWFLIVGFWALAFLPVFWQFMHDYQKQRILTFFYPSSDPLGKSYNSIQAIIAVGSGLFLGKGIGQGTQSVLRFLPERHTDFIFAALCESFGFVGGTIVIILFGFLLYRIFSIYLSSDDIFRKVLCISGFLLISIQCFINIAMNIGLVPIVGITLPFVSYGGSSLISSFILLGILSSFSSTLRSREVLEIR